MAVTTRLRHKPRLNRYQICMQRDPTHHTSVSFSVFTNFVEEYKYVTHSVVLCEIKYIVMKITQYIPKIHKFAWFDNWTHGIYRTLSIEFHLQVYSVYPWYLNLMFDLVRKIAWATDLIDVFGRVGAATYWDLHSCIDISISGRSVIHELISLFLLCIHLFCVVINTWDMAQVKIGLNPYASVNHVSIGSDKSLSPIRHQSIVWANAGH